MRFIKTKCKICHKPVTVSHPDPDANEVVTMQKAVDNFLPLVTCNMCYDAFDKRERAGATIFNTCHALAVLPASKRTRTIMDNARAALQRACPMYADAIATQSHSPKTVYHESAVQLFLDKPEACSRILKEWRAKTRELAKVQQEIPYAND